MKKVYGFVLYVAAVASSIGVILYLVPTACSYLSSPTPDDREAANNYVNYVLDHSTNNELKKADVFITAKRNKVIVQVGLSHGMSESEVVSEFSKELAKCKLKHVVIEVGTFDTIRVPGGHAEYVEKIFKRANQVDLR